MFNGKIIRTAGETCETVNIYIVFVKELWRLKDY